MTNNNNNKNGSSIPTVYCQRTHANEALCSLMSAVLQRNVRSKRFDRNQNRKVKSSLSHSGSGDVLHVPQGPHRSNIVIVVILRDDERAIFDSTIAIGTNRGHTVAGIFLPVGANPSQMR
jgi:hypothetical protein